MKSRDVYHSVTEVYKKSSINSSKLYLVITKTEKQRWGEKKKGDKRKDKGKKEEWGRTKQEV